MNGYSVVLKPEETPDEVINETIPVIFTCPGYFQGKCPLKEDITWCHTKCSKVLYIDVYGDITCSNGCHIPDKYKFIQHWKFDCGKHQAEVPHKTC